MRLTLIDKVRGSNNQAPRSYVKEDGISLVHQTHSTMITLTPSVNKFAEDKEHRWFVFCIKPWQCEAPRSYVKDDGISMVHQSLSRMLSLCRTQFILSPSVTKFAEDKERGWFAINDAFNEPKIYCVHITALKQVRMTKFVQIPLCETHTHWQCARLEQPSTTQLR